MFVFACTCILLASTTETASTGQNVAMSRILNGRITDITEHPYQVALVDQKNLRIICGGALVKPKVVFTAAHCTHRSDLTPRLNLSVLVGANTVKDPQGTVHKIDKVIKHPEYTTSSYDNDFSIVLLKNPVGHAKARPIHVSLKDDLQGRKAVVSGWGQTEFGTPAKELRAVKVTIERHSKCQDHFPRSYHPRITRNMVCVKPDVGSTYYGDSGGPLVVDDKLVGLVSFGRTVHGDKKTTVFTRVKNFLGFADEVIPPQYLHEQFK